jgi:hypothetical protein
MVTGAAPASGQKASRRIRLGGLRLCRSIDGYTSQAGGRDASLGLHVVDIPGSDVSRSVSRSHEPAVNLHPPGSQSPQYPERLDIVR